MSRTLAHAGSERLVRLNVFCEVQQEMWLWWAGEWLQTAGKASMTPQAADDEKGTNRHLYTVHFHVQCIFPLKRWYYAPYDIHRRLEWSQLGRHFIVNLLLLFVRLTALHRRCRDRQDSFCRLLTLTGRSRRIFILSVKHMDMALVRRTASAFEGFAG